MIDRVDVSSVLMQMRQVKDQLRTQHEQSINSAPASRGVEGMMRSDSVARPQSIGDVNRVNGDSMKVSGDNTVPDFQTMFKTAIDNVNENQKVAGNLATRFEHGDASIDLPEVMIALQKSSVSFQAMTQVRNKLVEAYKDIMNMPV